MKLGERPHIYPHSSIMERSPFRWPGDARLAVIIMPNIEHFELETSSGGVPDVKNYSQADYGNRVAVWRIFEMLDQCGAPATLAMNESVCRHFPEIVEAGNARECEFIGHGLTNSEDLDAVSDDEADQVIRRSLATLRSVTSRPVTGWLSTGLAERTTTLGTLVEEGVKYVCDWGLCDDQPFRMNCGLYAMPYSLELNDKRFFSRSGSAADFKKAICDSVDALYRDGEKHARVMCVSLHPFLAGVPHRIGDISEALDYVANHTGVWLARGCDVLDAYCSMEQGGE